jgi:hypothetical protein
LNIIQVKLVIVKIGQIVIVFVLEYNVVHHFFILVNVVALFFVSLVGAFLVPTSDMMITFVLVVQKIENGIIKKYCFLFKFGFYEHFLLHILKGSPENRQIEQAILQFISSSTTLT